MDFLIKPWPWHFSGLVIGLIMMVLLFFGKSFGFSANLRTICTIAGGDKIADFFKFDWKKQTWNLVFLGGAVLGGFIANQFLSDGSIVAISENTIADLAALGISAPTEIQPTEIFSWDFATSFKGILFLIIGGFLVGFGARYAGGCTSGHAISGLSDLQLPSLIAVVGFFIGGLLMTYLILPLIL
ncbi:MAG: YeeE/YedE family protein [Cryomorphaceae bacterium]|nr:YeeE/YedE family protein [Cryomorphaceae bacterium]